MTDLTRRTTLKTLGACSTVFSFPATAFSGMSSSGKPTRLGVIADLHGGLAADAEPRLDHFLKAMAKQKLDGLVQLGDFAYPNKKHQIYADKLNAAHDNVVHVIGNHEFDYGLKRADCYKAWGIKSAYYRRDLGNLRLLVLDGNEKGSPTYKGGYQSYIGKKQQAWLAAELLAANKPVVILSHQPLAGRAAIDSATHVQKLLAQHKDKIVLCINGHTHVDCLLQVDGVNYLHVNSASYYWVGGKTRMADYQEPLYTTVTIDPQNSLVNVDASVSSWKKESPADIGFFKGDRAPPETIVTPQIRKRKIELGKNKVTTQPAIRNSKAATSLKVMTWNIWGRLNQDPRYTINDKTARKRTIEIIQKSGADIVAMIETYGSAADIAKALKFHHYTSAADANLCIFSRYPLSDIEPLKGLSSFSFIAATATLPDKRKVRIYDVWLTSSGRHIVEIKNKKLSDEKFNAGDDVRYRQLKKFLEHADLKKHLANAGNVPVIAAGDFNCVSHLDHNRGTQQSKLNHSRVLATKVSKAMHQAGFSDSYRQANPDILESTLGHTWTTVGQGYVYKQGQGFVPVKTNPQPEYRDPYARIDYIYSAGSRLQPKTSTVITHHPSRTDRSFPEFPSDHAAVLTEFVFSK